MKELLGCDVEVRQPVWSVAAGALCEVPGKDIIWIKVMDERERDAINWDVGTKQPNRF